MLVKFKLNKNLDKKIILEFLDAKAGGIDFGSNLIKLHPSLKVIKNKSIKEKKEFISKFVDSFYKTNNLKPKLKQIEEAWKKVEDSYFEEIKKLFKIKGKKYTAYFSIINFCPRWITKKEFTISYYFPIKKNLVVICHELTHFFFYDYISKHFARKLSANEKWHLSEIFNVVILNQKQFAKLYTPVKELAYPAHKKYIKQYKELFDNSKDLKGFLNKAIKLTKKNF